LEALECEASSHHIVARGAFGNLQHSQVISSIAEVGWLIGHLCRHRFDLPGRPDDPRPEKEEEPAPAFRRELSEWSRIARL
jgi:hypothetical protein